MEWVLSFSDNTIPHFPYTFNKNFLSFPYLCRAACYWFSSPTVNSLAAVEISLPWLSEMERLTFTV